MNKQERIINAIKNMNTNEKVGIFNLFHATREERNFGIYSIDAFDEIVRKLFNGYEMKRIVMEVRGWPHINFDEDEYFIVRGSSNAQTASEETVNKYINDVAAELIAEYCIENNEDFGNEAIRKVMHRMSDDEIDSAIEKWLEDMDDDEYIELYNCTHCDEIHDKSDVNRELRHFFDGMSFSEIVDSVSDFADDYYDSEYFAETCGDIRWFDGIDTVKDATAEDLAETIKGYSEYWSYLPDDLKEAMEYYGDEE